MDALVTGAMHLGYKEVLETGRNGVALGNVSVRCVYPNDAAFSSSSLHFSRISTLHIDA